MDMEKKLLEKSTDKIQRLCGEIKLFDLCDLNRCRYRDGRYCTDPDLLARFESIADEDDSGPVRTVFVDEADEDDTLVDDDTLRFGDDDGYGNSEEQEDWED